MILAVDVGNSNITIGVYKENTLAFVARFATDRNRTESQYAIELAELATLYNVNSNDFSGSVLSCVVPELTDVIKTAITIVTNKNPIILAPGIKTGLNILLDNPSELGGDLAAGAVGAIVKYPLPALIIDLGTATKAYIVSDKNEFIGGMIAPGVNVSMRSLSSSCSMLPTVSLNAPKKAIGTNTIECIQSGVVYGFVALIDGILDRFIDEYGEVKSIIATGGLAKDIAKHCSHNIVLDSELILDGLKAIYDKNR